MTYLSDKSASRRRTFRLSFIIVILLVVSFGWVQIKKSLLPVVVPTYVATHSTLNAIMSIPYGIVNYFRARDTLQAEIARLQNRSEELENQITLLQAQKNESITSSTVDTSIKSKPVVVLYPLAQDVTKIYSTLLLSKGFKDDVPDGAVVYVRGRQPVCIITELHASTALCKLLSAAGNTVDGVTTSTKQNVTLTGEGGGNYVALVPKESNFVTGEDVMYQADPTMKLGEIVDIKNDPQDIFVRVYIRGVYNPVTLHTFYVDKK